MLRNTYIALSYGCKECYFDYVSELFTDDIAKAAVCQADLSTARYQRLACLDAQMQESVPTGCHTLFKRNQHEGAANILSHHEVNY